MAGETIICDRYAFSGLAFSASKLAPGTNAYPLLSYTWCLTPDAGLPSPDITLFLDVSSAVARTRAGFGDERYEKEDVQLRVRDVFVRIGEQVEGSGGRWEVVDADLGLGDVEEVVWESVKGLVGGVDGPVGRLWEDKREKGNTEALYM